MIQITDLKFKYSSGPVVLDIPTWNVEPGEKVFLHGPSGSGKTTLLSLLTGIANPTQGSLSVMGKDYKSLTGRNMDSFRGNHIGYIFQSFNLIPYLSIAENILLPLKFAKLRAGRINDGTGEAMRLANTLGIADLFDKSASDLSVGQQQRVAAARALIGGPELIIADEPTSSLDTDHRNAFIALLLEQATQSNSTVVFVSHDLSLAKQFDKKVALNEINRVGAK